MESKICSKCKEEKGLNEFHNCKQKSDGKQSSCKTCRSIICKQSRENNYNNYKNRMKQQNFKRKDKKSLWYYEDKKNNYDKYKEKWDEQNFKRKEEKASWYQENKDRIVKNNNEKRREDPKLKIGHNISKMILRALKEDKAGKSWEDILGYNIDILIEHLEKVSEISVQDYLVGNYDMDHIIPVYLFNYSSYEDEDFIKCWNYRNLRIISREENLKKSKKFIKELVLFYDIEDLLPKEVSIGNL